MIEQMWNIYYNMIDPKPTDKIICPITGGLDSRVTAWVLAKKNIPFISYYVYDEHTKQNLPYIKKIATICGVTKLHLIRAVTGQIKSDTAVSYLSKIYDLKRYIRYIPTCNDMITGLGISKKRHRNYWVNKNTQLQDIAVNYGEMVDSTGNQKWVGYCYSLPFSHRIFQKAYIQMINDYTPLGSIPRCFEGNQKPVRIDLGVLHYCFSRILQRIRGI